MKHTLKKYFAFVLATIFSIAAIAAIPVAAGENDPLDANLVIHYDFEGADILEAMKDKATAGSVQDDIAPIAGKINFSGLTVDNENGTVTHTSSAAGLRTDRSADTDTVGGTSTWFVRTKLARGDEQQYFFIVEMRTFGSASVRPFGLQYDAKNQKLCVYISEESAPSKGQNLGFAYEYDYTAGEYLNIAVSVSQAEVDGKQVYQSTLHVAQGLPQTAADWTTLGTMTIGAGIAQPTDANKLNLISNGSAGCALGVTLDDVRLYNKALTLDEIATIIPNGSFDGQLKKDPVVTDAPTEEITNAPEAPKTDAPTQEVTKAPTAEVTQAPTATGSQTTETPTENKGCGASASIGGVLLIALACAAYVFKKEEQ